MIQRQQLVKRRRQHPHLLSAHRSKRHLNISHLDVASNVHLTHTQRQPRLVRQAQLVTFPTDALVVHGRLVLTRELGARGGGGIREDSGGAKHCIPMPPHKAVAQRPAFPHLPHRHSRESGNPGWSRAAGHPSPRPPVPPASCQDSIYVLFLRASPAHEGGQGGATP